MGLGEDVFYLLLQFDGLLHMHTNTMVSAEYSQPLTSHTLQDSQSFLTTGQVTAWNLYHGDTAKSLHNFIGYVVKLTPSYDVEQ